MNRSIKHIVPLAAILLASLCAACGSSTAIVGPPPPPPTGNFSSASLKGQYAFSMSGREACGNIFDSSARPGTFSADGQRHITDGLEDVHTCSFETTLQFTSGSYPRASTMPPILPLPPH